MKFTRDDFKRVTPMRGWCIIKPEIKNHYTNGGLDIIIQGLKQDNYKYVPRTGVIKKSSEYPVGLYVWFDYLGAMNSLGLADYLNRVFYEVDDEIYLQIRNDEVYVLKDNTGIYSVDGYYIVRQRLEQDTGVIIKPDVYKKNSNIADIIYTPKTPKELMLCRVLDKKIGWFILKCGDTVHTNREWGVCLESEYYDTLGKDLFILQEDKIIGIYGDNKKL
jgi:hypothetical protein